MRGAALTARNTTKRDRDRAAIRRAKPPCGICGEPIDYSLPYLDPGEFVVDHIVPLAKGGTDELANKQAAHRRPGTATGRKAINLRKTWDQGHSSLGALGKG